MKYEPQVNHFVRWKKGVEGWVYFKDKQYLTIEVSVRPKTEESYKHCCLHKNDRLLVLCYHDQWKDLEYVETRQSVHEKTQNSVEIDC